MYYCKYCIVVLLYCCVNKVEKKMVVEIKQPKNKQI